MYKYAYKHDDQVIFYFDFFGNKYAASGGNLAWRINNPGLLSSHSHFSRISGSIGSCDGYAIFGYPHDGRKALEKWLRSKKYYNSTLKTIAEHYQPNAPNEFLKQLFCLAKISLSTKVKSLNEREFSLLCLSIEKICGYTRMGSEVFSLLPKIIAKIENGKEQEESYLVDDNIVLSKAEAIQLVISNRLDAVIIHEKNKKIHLRSRPNHSFQKNRMTMKGLQPLILEGREFDILVRTVGVKVTGQCVWGFINGINNTKEQAMASATLISQSTGGEQVLLMPNDTINPVIDFCLCVLLKSFVDTPKVLWTAIYLRYLLKVAKREIIPSPVVVFAHSQGAIYVEHALELLDPNERNLLRVFTFGGGSYIVPGKAHPDTHNYASAADYVCRFVSPKMQYLVLRRYYGFKEGRNEQQVIRQLAYEDAILESDLIDPKGIERYTERQEKFYEEEFSKLRHITILDPDPGSNWKHGIESECYQAMIRTIIRKYQKK